MARTQEFIVSCGTGEIAAHLPIERTRIPPGPPFSAAALPDAAEAFRRALANPVGMPPLEKLVKKDAKVTSGIQDGRAAHYHERSRGSMGHLLRRICPPTRVCTQIS